MDVRALRRDAGRLLAWVNPGKGTYRDIGFNSANVANLDFSNTPDLGGLTA